MTYGQQCCWLKLGDSKGWAADHKNTEPHPKPSGGYCGCPRLPSRHGAGHYGNTSHTRSDQPKAQSLAGLRRQLLLQKFI